MMRRRDTTVALFRVWVMALAQTLQVPAQTLQVPAPVKVQENWAGLVVPVVAQAEPATQLV